jgi:poly-D-alanine transfer protein DltD
MKKDIFIDNNIASRYLSNPTLDEYKKLIEWLMMHQKNEETDAYLVISPFLLKEYIESNRNANSKTNIVQIIDLFTKQNRLIRFDKKQIEAFQTKHFTKKVIKKMQSNAKDRNHIPAVLMSDRKMALSEDANFLEDLQQFTEFNPVVARNPDDLDYEN